LTKSNAIALSRKLVNLYESLSPPAQVDYLLLNDLSLFLVRSELYNLAFHFTDLLFDTYGHTAGIYYHLIRGQAYQETGRVKAAERCFKAASKQRSALPFAHLGNLYFLQHKIDQYIKTVKQYLAYSRKPDVLKSLFLISLAYETALKPTLAQKTLRILVTLGNQLINLPPSEREILQRAVRKLPRNID